MSNKSPLVIEELENKENNIKVAKESKIEERTRKELSIPLDYIPINLFSNGRLGYPKTLHFRDYTIDDMLRLDTVDERDQLKGIIQALNNMIWEKDFDCMNLHIKDVMTIVYTLHGSFISGKIEKQFHKDDTLEEGDEPGFLDHEDNLIIQEIPLSCFKQKLIDQDEKGKNMTIFYKEPFKIRDKVKNKDYYFILPRVGHMITAYMYADELYFSELRKFNHYKRELKAIAKIKSDEERDQKVEALEDNNPEDWKEYLEFTKKHDHAFVLALKYQSLVRIGDRELNTLEDKMMAAKDEVSTVLWSTYDSITKGYDFGLKEEVTFKSDAHQGASIKRRFLFQVLDFLPALDKINERRFEVSFD